MADRQYLRPSTNMFDRGAIYFADKDSNLISAATLKVGYFIGINPTKIKDANAEADTLAGIIPEFNKSDFIARAAKPADTYEEIIHRLNDATADKVKSANLPGVYIYKERWRIYPAGTLASHLIGFLGYNGNIIEGRYGLEKAYNDVLARNTNATFVNFFAEVFSSLGKKILERDDRSQGDIVLTIDPQVQSYLEKQLQVATDKWQPDLAGGVVMDPKTGEILGMATLPNFDPAGKQDNISMLNNPIVDRVYEMGSIVKPLTMAAALDTGAVTPETKYKDTGFITLNNKKISNYDGKARGVVNMQEVLNHSLNVGAAWAEQKMGKDAFRTYFKNYGLGEKTGIDLPNEQAGLINNLNSPREVEYATAAFGQGIAVSPIEITRALATLANGGYLVTPHVVKSIHYKTLVVKDIKPVIGKQVLKPETSTTISRMLTNVVDVALANGTVKQEHYSIAAKTGTAQMVGPDGKYYDDRYLHSFFGYAPSYNPKFIIFLYVVYPKNVQYASETLTMPFMDLTKFLINYYEIPPDR
jgi:cell division protein FtsI/penicillin-binding protein 2